MSLFALVIALALLVPALWVARRGMLRRLAWRNVTARPAEAVLVGVGTMLGTAIIVASFVVGDTVESGVGSVVDTSLGPIDESVTIEDPVALADLETAIRSADLDDVDGAVGLLSLPTAVTTVGDDPVGESGVWIAEVDFDEARAFGGDTPTSGFADAGHTPVRDEAVINSRIARQLGVEAGDRLTVHVFGSSLDLEVRQVIDRYSAAGFNSVYIAPGTIEGLVANASAEGPQPRAEVVVSNRGDFVTGAELTTSVVEGLEAVTADFEGVDIENRKESALEQAEADGVEFTTLFNGIGSFAVIAGILLIVNLFVMLSEERKTALGILRAIGFSRGQVARAFAIEGAVYSATATVIGVGAGIGVGWVLVQALKAIFFDENDFLTIGFDPQVESVMLAAAIGLGITMITIWFTAFRISRFNVIAAVRDLPQPPSERGRVRGVVLGALGIVAGSAVTFLGLSQEIPSAAMAGIPVMAFSAIPILRLFTSERITGLIAGGAAMTWGILVFAVYPDVMRESDIDTFVVQGVVLVTAAVVMSASLSSVWSRMVDLVARGGAGLGARLGLVYPLAHRGRTGLLLGMFSLVIFTITFLSVFAQMLGDQTRGIADDSRAGYDIMAASARFNPVTEEQVDDVDGVGSVASLALSWAEFEVEGEDEPVFWRVTGFDSSLLELGTPALSERAAGYETDLEVFQAVMADSSLIVIDDFFLDNGSGPGTERHAVGSTVTMYTEDDIPVDVTIAGIMSSDWVFAGSYMSGEYVEANLDARDSRFYVAAEDGVDPEVLAGRLNATLLDHGMEAETFTASVEAEVAETLGIFRLFQGFLSLGLLIGIAGLSVVLVRAVRERRRAIGVLRALGTQPKVVRRAFLVESAFIAVQGVVIGAVLGLVTAYQVIVNSSTFGDANLDFAWPWAGLAVALLIPTAAALLAAALPAKRASAISPAVALRTE
ncbi:MAG: FtsX-like permease family protein [Acidimicrobiia bacterium]|jgi:putative ABC transport system permease protein